MADSEPLRAATPEQVLEVVQASDELFMSTAEITEYFDATRPTVLDRLRTLEDESAVRSKDIGTSKAWYTPDRENYRLARFADDGGVSFGELQDLLDKYGAERLEQAIKIIEENDGLDEADIEVLQVAASALAQGRDRQEVIKVLQTDRIQPGGERLLARVSFAALIGGAGGTTWALMSLVLGSSLPFGGSFLAGGIAAVIVGFLGLAAAVSIWSLRRAVGGAEFGEMVGINRSEPRQPGM